jgi:uncharacterized protein
MTGTWLNLAGILAGGLAGLILRRPLRASTQQFLKMALGVYTVVIGLRLALTSLHGNLWQILKQLCVVVLALMAGRLLGRLFRLQTSLNRLGRQAGECLSRTGAGVAPGPGQGFRAATILFCAAPLAVLGPIPDGLSHDYQPLLLKAVMDALVTLALVPTFGWTVLLAVVPVAALQVTVTHAAQLWEPVLRTYSLFDPVYAVCGLLIFCLALIIFGIRKVAVADYLPALVLAPLVSWLWR